MAIDTTSPRTRRAILLGALGGAAASVAVAVGRANPVRATNGEPVLVGGSYSATATTSMATTGLNAAFWGTSESIAGVGGTSQSGFGVQGASNTYVGVRGDTNSTVNPAVLGQSAGDNTGVQGYSRSGPGVAPSAPANTGVYGYAAQDDSARGVTGESTAGRGVFGVATSGTGVFGKANGGEGVRGVSTNSNGTTGSSGSAFASGVYGENTGGGYGTYGRSNTGAGYGVYGESTSGTGVVGNSTTGIGLLGVVGSTGIALKTQGRVLFSTSGLAAIAIGSRSKTIKPGTDLVTNSRILCTLESNQTGLLIQHLTKDTVVNTFTAALSAAVQEGKYAKVAWFVIG